jgi:hypothetical protein
MLNLCSRSMQILSLSIAVSLSLGTMLCPDLGLLTASAQDVVPSLTNEKLNGSSTSGNSSFCPTPRYAITGTATGPYPGTFTETATWNAAFGIFTSTFTITSGAITVNGTKNAGGAARYMSCGETGAHAGLDTIMAVVSYSATIHAPSGDYLDEGQSPSSVTITADQMASSVATYGSAGNPVIALLAQPQRLIDTRTGIGGYTGQIAPGTERCFTVAGVDGVPTDATGVVVNLTAVGQTDTGWLSLSPAPQALPHTSTLNFDPYEHAIANGAMVRLGSGGELCIGAGGSSAFAILDVNGYFTSYGTTSSASIALLPNPVRIVDTRFGVGGFTGRIVQDVDRCFTVAGTSDIPTDVAGVLLNVTAVDYVGNGSLTLYPYGQSVPSTSTVNFDGREYAIANNAIIKSGTVCVHASSSPSYVVIDVSGYITAAGLREITLITPERVVDTRTNLGGLNGWITPGSSQCFEVAGRAGVPRNAVAGAIINITAVGYTGNGWLTLYPDRQSVPPTSALNFDFSGSAISAGEMVRLGTSGQVCVDTGQNATHVILDVTGLLPAIAVGRFGSLASAATPTPAPASRLLPILTP